jgi:signal transduction histidine kinase
MMNVVLPRTQPNPFRFLLYTEWLMLASCGAMAAFEAVQRQSLPVQHILILILLGGMGLFMPRDKTWLKVLYTASAIGLIFYGTTLGYLHILPTLYLIVVIRSCFLFESPLRWLVVGISLMLFLVHQWQYVQTLLPLMLPAAEEQRIWMHQIAEILMFGLGLFFVSQLVNTLLTERKVQEQLAIAHDQLRHYALQIEELAAVQERNRIARDIHDSLGHALTSLNIQVQTAAKLLRHDPSQAKPFLEQAQRLGTLAMQEVRQSVHALRADAEADTSLEADIRAIAEDFRQGTGVTPALDIDVSVVLSPTMSKTLYRIVQEALTNISKYAHATAVNIRLFTTPDYVHLTVEDNGQGFNPKPKASGYGLQGMQERVAVLQGSFHLETSAGRGCRILVQLPL